MAACSNALLHVQGQTVAKLMASPFAEPTGSLPSCTRFMGQAVELKLASTSMGMQGRIPLQVMAMKRHQPAGKCKKDSVWITALQAVGLALATAGAAAFGGFMLSQALENEYLADVEEIEKLKEQGLWKDESEPSNADLEGQGVGAPTRKRPVRDE